MYVSYEFVSDDYTVKGALLWSFLLLDLYLLKMDVTCTSTSNPIKNISVVDDSALQEMVSIFRNDEDSDTDDVQRASISIHDIEQFPILALELEQRHILEGMVSL